MTVGQLLDAWIGAAVDQLHKLPPGAASKIVITLLPVALLHFYLRFVYTPQSQRAVSFAWEVPPEAQ